MLSLIEQELIIHANLLLAKHEDALSLLKQEIVLLGFSFHFVLREPYIDDDVHNYYSLIEIGESFGLFGNTVEFHRYTRKRAFSS